MKVVILAGGFGTRLSEETDLKPKPMVEIGGKPILWHIMKIFSTYGLNDFVICCGYKGYLIKEYFANYYLHQSDITVNTSDNSVQVHKNNAEAWTITLIDTGENTMTGGRLKRVYDHVKDDDAFCFTYGDGIGDIDVSGLIAFHKKHGKLSTLTAVAPRSRYGAVKIQPDNRVVQFQEKPITGESWISGGFFVLNPKAIERIKGDDTSWELEPLSGLVKDNELFAFKHTGFWQPMDTLRDKVFLDKMWAEGNAPWKIWQ